MKSGPIVTLGAIHHFNQLQAFAFMVSHQSVTKASRQLRISQPALSRHLKNLQGNLGALYNIRDHQIVLTRRGEALYSELEPILSTLAEVNRRYRVGSAPAAGPLVVAASYGPAISILPRVINRFQKHHRSLEIEFKVGTGPEMQDLVVNSQADLAIVTGPYPSPSLEMEPFRELRLCFFVSARHPLTRMKTVNVESLTEFPLVIAAAKKSRPGTDELLTELAERKIKATVLRCEWPDAVKAVVSDGASVGILFQELVEPEASRGKFRILKMAGLELSALSYIVYAKEKPLPQNAQEFLGLLRGVRPRKPGAQTIVSDKFSLY